MNTLSFIYCLKMGKTLWYFRQLQYIVQCRILVNLVIVLFCPLVITWLIYIPLIQAKKVMKILLRSLLYVPSIYCKTIIINRCETHLYGQR